MFTRGYCEIGVAQQNHRPYRRLSVKQTEEKQSCLPLASMDLWNGCALMRRQQPHSWTGWWWCLEQLQWRPAISNDELTSSSTTKKKDNKIPSNWPLYIRPLPLNGELVKTDSKAEHVHAFGQRYLTVKITCSSDQSDDRFTLIWSLVPLLRISVNVCRLRLRQALNLLFCAPRGLKIES